MQGKQQQVRLKAYCLQLPSSSRLFPLCSLDVVYLGLLRSIENFAYCCKPRCPARTLYLELELAQASPAVANHQL